jgi:hypothetical protein
MPAQLDAYRTRTAGGGIDATALRRRTSNRRPLELSQSITISNAAARPNTARISRSAFSLR